MHPQLRIWVPTIASLALVVACGSGGGGDNNSGNSVETDLTATITDANLAVSQYAASSDPAGGAAGYYAQVGNHIDHMSDLWDHMDSHCRDIPDCPANGGFTGDWDGHCWSDGHMMDDSEMSRLHDSISSARHELDDYWNACGQAYQPGTCDTRWHDHTAAMHDMFGQMDHDCSGWWSHDGSHWGDCGMHG
jgi:hypothetical protein